jgi:hypothetical protein
MQRNIVALFDAGIKSIKQQPKHEADMVDSSIGRARTNKERIQIETLSILTTYIHGL